MILVAVFQSVLGAEGLSLAFRHIVSSLLWYCSQHSSEELLHEVIICIGYFTVNHPDNQVSKMWTRKHNSLLTLFKKKIHNHGSSQWGICYRSNTAETWQFIIVYMQAASAS